MGKSNKPTDVFQHIDMSGGEDACWPWKRGTGGGTGRGKARPYFQVDGKKWIVYRLVWKLVKGEDLPEDVLLCHKCDNSICCNPKHLEKGTHQDNMDDMVKRDRHGLPSHTVRRIRIQLIKGEMTHAEIGEMYAVSRSLVTRIANDQAHTHANDYPTEDENA